MVDDDRTLAADVSADDSETAPDSDATDSGAQQDASSESVGTPTAAEPSGNAAASGEGADEPASRSEVVVPMALYKVVTVFSTLFAVAFVVGGMIALDVATGRATFDADEIRLPIAFLGVAAIVLGAAIYAFAARFRAEGMGNPKDRDDED